MNHFSGKSAVLAISSCLIFQGAVIGTILIQDRSQATAAELSEDSSDELIVPLFHMDHAKEILNSRVARSVLRSPAQADISDQKLNQDRPVELTYFINKRVFQMLPKTWRPRSAYIAQNLIETSNKHQLDPLFLMAMIQHESRFNPVAVGPFGEIGLMQIRPSTARWLLGFKVNDPSAPSDADLAAMLRDPETNIALGASYLSLLRTRFQNQSEFYIAAYNMGSNKVRDLKAQGVSPRIYKTKVMKEYARLTKDYRESLLDLMAPVRQIASLELSQRSVAGTSHQTFVLQ